ncbi:MAG: ABC transporter permease [Azospirillaceae bacterium]
MTSTDQATGSDTPRRRPFAAALSVLLNQAPLLVLVALCLTTVLNEPRFMSPINLTNITLQASVLAVVAMGMTYVIIAGGFDLSVGSIVALSGCIGAMVMLELGPVVGALAGVVIGAAVGAVNGFFVAYLRLNPFIATLGTMVAIRGLVLLITHAQPIVGDEGLPRSFVLYGRERFLGLPLLTWTPIVLFFILAYVLERTAYGRKLYAAGGGPEAAFLAGIPVKRIKASSYVWSGALAGVAGVMLAARLQSGQPTSGEFYELLSIAAVVLGGASLYGGEGRLYKTIIGLMIIIVLSNSLNLMDVDSHWQDIAIGAVILLAASVDQLRHRLR